MEHGNDIDFSQPIESGKWLSDRDVVLTEEEIIELKNNAYELKCFDDFEEVVRLLLEKKKAWENCYIEFHWKKLYSFESEDEMYLKILWGTKAQRELEEQKLLQEDRANYLKRQLEAIENIPLWIEEGKNYIDEWKWPDWIDLVNKNARSVYKWRDVEVVLELLKLIENWASWEDVRMAFSKFGTSGASSAEIKKAVVRFSRKWEEAKKELL